MKKFICIIVLILLIVGLVGIAEAGKVELVSGVASTEDGACYGSPYREKCLTLTNTGASTYVIREDAETDTVTIVNTDNTVKYCTRHTFNSIELTESGGAAVEMIMRCR